MTNRFWLLTVTIYGLLFLGMATLQGTALLLAIPLLVYLGAAILFAPLEEQQGRSHLSIQRQVSAHVVTQNTPVQIKVTLVNEGPAADELFLQDNIPAKVKQIQGDTRKLIPLAAGETAELDYSVSLGRGELDLQNTQAILSEHFGLLQRAIQLTNPGKIRAIPESLRLRKLTIQPQQTRGFSGPIPARQKGSGMSFWGVREYQMGDSLRRINWKVSARRTQWRDTSRTQDLFSNEFEQERIADVGLILDAREQTNTFLHGQDLFEYSVQATAALSEAFLADGHRVSLLTYGYGMSRVYPGYGKIQRELILNALAKVTPGSNYALESLNNLPTRLFPARSQLVMISPLGAQDFPAFIRLSRDDYEVLLVSPDPVSFAANILSGKNRPEDLPNLHTAMRLARLERNLLLRKLNRLGVQVVDWPVDQPLDRTLNAVLGRQRLFRRNLKAVGL
jgi:uncharacterized protein (DUF58 family)